jgi:hypothetical protein
MSYCLVSRRREHDRRAHRSPRRIATSASAFGISASRGHDASLRMLYFPAGAGAHEAADLSGARVTRALTRVRSPSRLDLPMPSMPNCLRTRPPVSQCALSCFAKGC